MSQMGRPKSESPKSVKITVRVDSEMLERLELYCKKFNLSKAEGLRKGIEALEIDENEKG